KTLAGVVFDGSADARQARGADAERASYDPVRLAKNGVFRAIVEGVLKLDEARWNVRDEQFKDFGDDIGAERLKLGQDNIVQNREGRLGCVHGTSLSNRCASPGTAGVVEISGNVAVWIRRTRSRVRGVRIRHTALFNSQ